MGVGPPATAWATYKKPDPQRKVTTYSHQSSIPKLRIVTLSPAMLGFLAGLLLYRS